MTELQRLMFWMNGIGIGLFVGGVLSTFTPAYLITIIGFVIILAYILMDTKEPEPEEPPDIDTVTLQLPDDWDTDDKRKLP